jgi:hypothetical protein
MNCNGPVAGRSALSRTLLPNMADNMQLPPAGGAAGYSAVAAQPGGSNGRALLTAVLLVVAGALLGLLGGVIWAAAAPRVVYQVYSLRPQPVAFATNAETSAFIATDGIYTFIAVGGGALLGLAGYVFGVRRYGPAPMAGVVLGAVAAAFLAKWLGPLLTGQDSFNDQLRSSKPGALLRAPIALGAHGALAFWPVAAAFVAGGLELISVMRARQASQAGGPGAAAAGLLFGRPQRGRRRLGAPQQQGPGEPPANAGGPQSPVPGDASLPGPAPRPWFPPTSSAAAPGDEVPPDASGRAS